MQAYPKEFRRNVLAACDAGELVRDTAIKLDVSESWIQRIKEERQPGVPHRYRDESQ